ncbi:hypothetical protein ACJRO7_016675 [Eucalyptus globulus]|uniref:Rapid ALkalinization Factor n=1 Tax=Eucalyptus globulus TaxID=34317 RepID=A0ABD3LCZ7_EUCGL
MEALPAGDNGRSLTFSSLLLVLLLASQASPSPHPSNISASTIAAAAASSPHNNSHSLTGGGLIADDMGLEYLIDSPHFLARILKGPPYPTYRTTNRNNAGCGRRGEPYRKSCLPRLNLPPNCNKYNRGCRKP